MTTYEVTVLSLVLAKTPITAPNIILSINSHTPCFSLFLYLKTRLENKRKHAPVISTPPSRVLRLEAAPRHSRYCLHPAAPRAQARARARLHHARAPWLQCGRGAARGAAATGGHASHDFGIY